MINIFILWMITEINTQTKMIALYATRDNFCQRTEIYVCQKVYVRHIKTHIWWGVWDFLNDWWLLVYVLECVLMWTIRVKHDQGNISDSPCRISVTWHTLLPFTQQDLDILHCVIKRFNYITHEYQCLCSQNACVCRWHNSLLISVPNAAKQYMISFSVRPWGGTLWLPLRKTADSCLDKSNPFIFI